MWCCLARTGRWSGGKIGFCFAHIYYGCGRSRQVYCGNDVDCYRRAPLLGEIATPRPSVINVGIAASTSRQLGLSPYPLDAPAEMLLGDNLLCIFLIRR